MERKILATQSGLSTKEEKATITVEKVQYRACATLFQRGNNVVC